MGEGVQIRFLKGQFCLIKFFDGVNSEYHMRAKIFPRGQILLEEANEDAPLATHPWITDNKKY